MFRKLLPLSLVLFCFLPAGYSHGFETKGQDCSKCHTLTIDEAGELLKNIFPGVKILDIKESPARGFWEVFAEAARKRGLFYVDFSKKYLIVGSMFSIKERKNLTQEKVTELNKVDTSQIPLEDALVMGDPKARLRVIVLTDPD